MLLSLNVTLFLSPTKLSFMLILSRKEKLAGKSLELKMKESSGLSFCHSMLLFSFFLLLRFPICLSFQEKKIVLEEWQKHNPELGASMFWVTLGSTRFWVTPGALMLPGLEGVTWHKAPSAEELTKTLLFDSLQVSSGYNKNKLKMYKGRVHYGGLPDLRSLRQIGGRKPESSHRLATMNQHPPAHHEGWMVSGQETVFCWVPVP